MAKNSKLVYSTELGRVCPDCGEAEHSGKCDVSGVITGDGRVRIQRETKGRKGAGVTLITGVPLAEKELKLLAKELKKKCGVGGAVKNAIIEMQGDQREACLKALANKGWDVKVAGG